MEELRSQRIFSFDRPIEEVNVVRKSRKVKRKNAPKIPRKTLSQVEQDLKVSYRKYVNSIRRKKSCRVKSFRAFANDRMGKKTRRGSRSVKLPVVSLPEMSLPETTPVVSPSEAPATEEMSLPGSTPETTPVVSPDVEASPSVEASPLVEASAQEEASTKTPSSSEAPASESEQKPAEEGSILKSVTDVFGLSSKEEVKKTGGRKCKGSAKSNKKKRNSRK